MLIEGAPLGIEDLLEHGDGHRTSELAWEFVFLEEIRSSCYVDEKLVHCVD